MKHKKTNKIESEQNWKTGLKTWQISSVYLLTPFYVVFVPLKWIVIEFFTVIFTNNINWLNNALGGKIRFLIGLLMFFLFIPISYLDINKVALVLYIWIMAKYLLYGFMLLAGFRYSIYKTDVEKHLHEAKQVMDKVNNNY